MNDILCKQLALDYCCREEDVKDKEHHFTEFSFLEGRRRFREEKDCFLKITIVNGKILLPEMLLSLDGVRRNLARPQGSGFLNRIP